MEQSKSPVWLLRIIYSSRIFVILLALVFAVIIWQKNTQKLTDSIENLSVSNPNIPLLESGIMRLYQADNNFRYYTITYDKNYFKDFAEDIRYISEILDTISKQSENDTTGIKLSGAINEKTSVAQVLVNLKKLTDSLLINSVRWDTTQPRKILLPTYDINKLSELSQTTTTDTLNTANKKTKKGFFRKVRDLFKEDEDVEYVKTVVSTTTSVKDTTIAEPLQQTPEYYVLNDIHQYYLDKFARIADGRNRLNDKEKQLAVINSDLIKQMQLMFAQLRDKEVEKVQKIKTEATQSGERSARRISVITIIAFLLASLSYFLILYYLRKINDRTKELEKQQLTISKLDDEKSGLRKLLRQLSENVNEDKKNQITFKEIVTELNFDSENSKMGIKSDFNPYNLISAISGEMLSYAKSKNLMIQSILPINQPVEVFGNKESLEKIISGILFFTIYNTLEGEISVKAKADCTETGKMLLVEVADNAKILTNKDIAAYLTESLPGVSKDAEESMAELKLINSRKLLESLGSELKITSEKNHNKYNFSINYPE
jgi:two-component system, sensor histidine kinase